MKLVETWEQNGTLPDSHWSNLRKILRYPRVTLALEIERRMAMAKRKDANAELVKTLQRSGVLKAVTDYMLSLPEADKRVPAMKSVLLSLGMPKRDVPKHFAQCVTEIFRRKQLVAVPEEAPGASATAPRAAVRATGALLFAPMRA